MILKKIRKQFELPDEGSHLAVFADLEDLGKKMTPWGLQEQVRAKWLLQQVGEDGKNLSVIATYNKSLNENSNLVQMIADITGTPPGDEFDTETLIGANARLTLKHQKKKKDGTIFPKIVATLPPANGDPVLRIPDWFQRAGGNNNTPPTPAPTSAPPKAAVRPTPPKSKAVPTAPSVEEQNKSLESPPEPPEPGDWDPSEYDEATSLPSNDAGSDRHAA
jgi:hypothetical protein